jgi:hypothetical protein
VHIPGTTLQAFQVDPWVMLEINLTTISVVISPLKVSFLKKKPLYSNGSFLRFIRMYYSIDLQVLFNAIMQHIWEIFFYCLQNQYAACPRWFLNVLKIFTFSVVSRTL